MTTILEDNFEEHYSRKFREKSPKISKQSQQVSTEDLALADATLADNFSSNCSVRPKRRTHKSQQVIKIHPPLSETSSSSCLLSPSTFNNVSSFKVNPSTPSFPEILHTLCVYSYAETPALNTKSFIENKLNLETTFSHSRRKSLTFNKSLSSKRLTAASRPLECVFAIIEANILSIPYFSSFKTDDDHSISEISR